MSDGGPAFPCTEPSTIEVSPGGAQTREWPIHLGMSLRDWFAGMVASGLCGDMKEVPKINSLPKDTSLSVVIAKCSYSVADAMLKERDA